ncbi:hypothetical protein BV25DRAFT_749881 [Artomyces pyxidatus]|uniref:Uncharacterized protein n=1 Tax=Artomyces pyxidatus TaxID=48021 RepID=A0ACB8SZ21_9AGAM|nr:hypothetical protein BV25DRAFT_749881 [Artomyces pyxidatus]
MAKSKKSQTTRQPKASKLSPRDEKAAFASGAAAYVTTDGPPLAAAASQSAPSKGKGKATSLGNKIKSALRSLSRSPSVFSDSEGRGGSPEAHLTTSGDAPWAIPDSPQPERVDGEALSPIVPESSAADAPMSAQSESTFPSVRDFDVADPQWPRKMLAALMREHEIREAEVQDAHTALMQTVQDSLSLKADQKEEREKWTVVLDAMKAVDPETADVIADFAQQMIDREVRAVKDAIVPVELKTGADELHLSQKLGEVPTSGHADEKHSS